MNEYLPDSAVARLYQQASLVVLPYVDGTQSGPLLLAYAFGKPVVVTNVGSLPEYVEDGQTGYVVPARNPEALADRIVKLLKDGKARRNMGDAGFRMSSERLSWETLAKSICRCTGRPAFSKNNGAPDQRRWKPRRSAEKQESVWSSCWRPSFSS